MKYCVSGMIYALAHAFEHFFESVEFKHFSLQFKSNFKLAKVGI